MPRCEDTIQGVPVRGQSLTASEISVRMIPDPHHVRMALEVNGEVAAVTRSTSGPATFYSDSESSYFARKPLEITLRGIRMWPTEVSVDNNSQLRGVATDFDRMPMFGQIARNMARSQYDEKSRPPTRKSAKRSPPRRRSGSIARRPNRLRPPPSGCTTRCSARWIRCCWIR